MRLLAATYAELVEGQTRELGLDFDLSHGIAAYEKVIGQKTASLIATSARLGAMASDADPVSVETVTAWAREVGMVFQIADDALDLISTADQLGKPAGSDIHEGKFTMPVLLALDGSDGERIRKLLDQPAPYPDEAVAEVIELVRDGGFVTATLDGRLARLTVADEALRALPDIDATRVLGRLGNFLVDRVAGLL